MVAALACLLPVALAAAPAPPLPSLDALRALIRPSAEELRFEQVPWRTELEGAVAEARERRLPLAVWVMNGHPLGGT